MSLYNVSLLNLFREMNSEAKTNFLLEAMEEMKTEQWKMINDQCVQNFFRSLGMPKEVNVSNILVNCQTITLDFYMTYNSKETYFAVFDVGFLNTLTLSHHNMVVIRVPFIKQLEKNLSTKKEEFYQKLPLFKMLLSITLFPTPMPHLRNKQ
jgi:hypothetical protein